VCFFIAVPFPLLAQRGAKSSRPSGGVIDVQVRYDNGQPGPRGLHIRLEAAEGGPAGDCETTDDGRCQFRLTSSGVYLVRMAVQGYKEQSSRVELIGTTQGFATLELKRLVSEADLEITNQPVVTAISKLDAGAPENARQEFEKGRLALNDHKLDAGIAHLRKAAKLYDSFPSAYTLLGTAFLTAENWKEAQTALQKAITLDPNSADAYLALGAVFNQTKDFPQAETALTRGLKLKPDAAAGHYELAKAYWSLGRWQDSAPHVRQAVAEMPGLPSPHVLMGNVFLKEGNARQALDEYQAYLRLEPNGPMAPGVRQMIEKIQKAMHP
jgi:tetratricopeptide (TPR) repeat protein